MSPQTFNFIGRSGCGKGTQAELLQKLLKEKDPTGEIFYLETGSHFREFIQGASYSNQVSAEVYKSGERQPDFVAIWIWADAIIKNLNATKHAVFDGITRSLAEAMTFSTALDFYHRKAYVIHLNVSRKWSEDKLLARGRFDDKTKEGIDKRLDWFEKDTVPALDYFNVHPDYTFLDINGEQSIEKVHQDIAEKIQWQ